MKIVIFLVAALFLLSCSKTTEIPAPYKKAEADNTSLETERYKEDLEAIKKTIKSDTKIKLKKDAKGVYSWEITGKDTREVLKANDTLSKRFSE